MNYSSFDIQSAINAAEAVEKPMAPGSTPVTVTQETLVRLIAAAKRLLERGNY